MCECVFVWKINSFDVIAIIYKVYKKGKSPIKKKVKVQDFESKRPFLFTLETVLKWWMNPNETSKV